MLRSSRALTVPLGAGSTDIPANSGRDPTKLRAHALTYSEPASLVGSSGLMSPCGQNVKKLLTQTIAKSLIRIGAHWSADHRSRENDPERGEKIAKWCVCG